MFWSSGSEQFDIKKNHVKKQIFVQAVTVIVKDSNMKINCWQFSAVKKKN